MIHSVQKVRYQVVSEKNMIVLHMPQFSIFVNMKVNNKEKQSKIDLYSSVLYFNCAKMYYWYNCWLLFLSSCSFYNCYELRKENRGFSQSLHMFKKMLLRPIWTRGIWKIQNRKENRGFYNFLGFPVFCLSSYPFIIFLLWNIGLCQRENYSLL